METIVNKGAATSKVCPPWAKRLMPEILWRGWRAAGQALGVAAWRFGADSRDDRWARDVDAPAEKIGTMLCNDVVLAVARMKFQRLAEDRRRGFKSPRRR